MRITYDGEADALYVELRAAEPQDSIDLEDGVTVDLDSQGHVIGREILGARRRLGKDGLSQLTVQRLNSEPVLRVRNDSGPSQARIVDSGF